MSKASAYRDTEHEVLIFNSRKIIDAYRGKIWLCSINSGCTKPFPSPRDYSKFSRINDYPYQHWRRKRGRHKDPVVELCIDDGISNVTDFVERVYVVRGEECLFDLTI